MRFYLTQEQIKVCNAIRELIASRLTIDPKALEKYNRTAFVNEMIVLHFRSGRPDYASFSSYNLGPFASAQPKEKCATFEVNDPTKFQRLLISHPNMTFVVDKCNPGIYVYTALAYDENGALIGDFGESG